MKILIIEKTEFAINIIAEEIFGKEIFGTPVEKMVNSEILEDCISISKIIKHYCDCIDFDLKECIESLIEAKYYSSKRMLQIINENLQENYDYDISPEKVTCSHPFGKPVNKRTVFSFCSIKKYNSILDEKIWQNIIEITKLINPTELARKGYFFSLNNTTHEFETKKECVDFLKKYTEEKEIS
jgi:hypothetical protein